MLSGSTVNIPDSATAGRPDPQVLTQLVSQFHSSIRQQCAAAFVLVLQLGGISYWQAQRPSILAWVTACMTMQLLLLGLTSRCAKPPYACDERQWWERYAVLAALGSASIYAIGPWVILDEGQPGSIALLAFSCLAVAASALQLHAPTRGAMVAFCVPLGISLAARLASLPGFENQVSAIVCLLCTIVFLSHGLQAHRMREAAFELESRNKALAEAFTRRFRIADTAISRRGQFLAAASHDVRQPLQAVNLLVDSLRRSMHEMQHADDWDQLALSVTALNESVNTMLEACLLDAGAVPMHILPVELDSVFAALNRTYRDRAESKQLALRFRSRSLWVRADEQLLIRLLGKLVDNAIKYTAQGGVLVAARVRRATGRQGVTIEIRDSGMGIPQAHHEQVFNDYFQAGSATRDRTQGLGMGLSIARRLAQMQRMHLEMNSAPGCGTTLRLEMEGVVRAAAPARPCD